MYICKKHAKSARIHIVYCLPDAFLSRIHIVYEEKILQIRAYTILRTARSKEVKKARKRRIGALS